MSKLIQKFETVCSTNGDDIAYYISILTSKASKKHTTSLRTVGFSELNENIKMIASELYYRHSIRPLKSTVVECSRPHSEALLKRACSQSVLIVSNQPSPGETAAVMACVRLHAVFVPLALDGPHRSNESRIMAIIKETNPIAAIVILSLPDSTSMEDENDWETKPALSNNETEVDLHPTVVRLNKYGVHRVVCVKADNGGIVGSLAGLSDCSLNLSFPNVEEESVNPMYMLYTSGSTGKPKAVVQTYSGLWNRICWQWKTFPFVQQMQRQRGLKETLGLLKTDGIVDSDSLQQKRNFDDIVLRRTSLSFVDSMAEIFGTLLGGASLYCVLCVDDGDLVQNHGMNLMEMLDLASNDGVRLTRMTCLPSQLRQALLKYNPKENNARNWTNTLDLVTVSGEPCPQSLPPLFDEVMKKRKALLLNLYGQTESAGDISCLIASSGRDKEASITRYPNAQKFMWKDSKSANTIISQKILRTLVPCGFPIDGHTFTIRPLQLSSESNSTMGELGRLYVSGPGICLGYYNNREEMLKTFSKADRGDVRGNMSDKPCILFNTMDLAFLDTSGMLFVLGRSARDADDLISDGRFMCSLTMGKLNGVMAHAAEIEAVFSKSLHRVLQKNTVADVTFNVNVMALLLNNSDKNETKSVVFLDLSSFPSGSTFYDDKVNFEIDEEIDAFDIKFSSGKKFHDIFIETRIGIMSENNHPSMVPHHILLVPNFPTIGAAGKVNKSLLAKIGMKILREKKDRVINKEQFSSGSSMSIEAVNTVFCSMFGLNPSEIERRPKTTFSELGGDSMMAIEAAYQILSTVRERGIDLSDDQLITPFDVMGMPIEDLGKILSSGRVTSKPKSKKPKIASGFSTGDLENLPSDATSFAIPENLGIGSNVIKVWKLPLLMCVDSSPVLITKKDNLLIVVASQGGDLAVLQSEGGQVLSRVKLKGKIEGDLNSLVNAKITVEPLLYVPSYNNGIGCIHALSLSEENSLTPCWEYTTKGEIKSKPAVFIYPGPGTPYPRLLCSSYDGSLSYLDATTGKLLQRQDDLGGAIHANPVVMPTKDSNATRKVSVLVASCTWKGKITFFDIDEKSMSVKWTLDLWTPIYATPYQNESSIVICGVDGTVRRLLCHNGQEEWHQKIGSRLIFTQSLAIDSEESNSHMVFGAHDGKLRCMNFADGSVEWSHDTHSPIFSNAISIGKKIVVANVAGSVQVKELGYGKETIVFEEKAKDIAAEAVHLDGEIYCNPVSSGKDIYIGCRDSCLYKLRVQ